MIQELKQIEKIRQLRTQSKRRKLAVSEATLARARFHVDDAQAEITRLEEYANTLHREGLDSLLSANVSSITDLLMFNSSKSRAQKEVAVAGHKLDEKIDDRKKAADTMNLAQMELSKAEKKLIGIEEVIAEKLWK